MENDQCREINDVKKKVYVAPELKKAQKLVDITEGLGAVVTGTVTKDE